jgi:RNA polymerase sigma-70 factor (ECF subfamily)
MLTNDIIEAARRGDEQAFAALYRELAPSVLGYLRGQGAADAEDLAGDVFVAVVQRLAKFDGDVDAFRSWVFTIAHHRLIDARRRRMRRPDEVVPDIVLHATAGVVTDLDTAVAERIDRQPLFAALARLSPDQRDTILLRVVADLSVERTADILGKQPGAVKALQRRALAALRRELSGRSVS